MRDLNCGHYIKILYETTIFPIQLSDCLRQVGLHIDLKKLKICYVKLC